MKCPSCQVENLPIRETSTMVGSKVCLPMHCGECGHALTEKCPVCTYHHAVGTKFCQADGTNIEAWIREESAWKRLVQTMLATLTVRPATQTITLLLAVLPGLYIVGGYWFQELVHPRYSMDIGEYVFAGVFAIITTGISMAFPVGIVGAVLGSIENRRRHKLFEAQQYRTLKPTGSVIES